MMRIKCPHCGAGNRDAQPQDTCWQCGLGLWEPANRQTYALNTRRPLSETTSLTPGQEPLLPVRQVVRDVRIAALSAVLALLLLLAAAGYYYLRNAAPMGADSPSPARDLRSTGQNNAPTSRLLTDTETGR